MDASSYAQTTLQTLRTVEFRMSLKGYNVEEVDEYLEKAAVEAESMTEQVRQMTERLRQATERIAQLENGGAVAPVLTSSAPEPAIAGDDALQRTLILAQKFVDQTKRESEAEAEAILAKAETSARERLSQAEEEARSLITESEGRLREEVARLESKRGQLAGDVENMARHLEAERDRLHGALTEMLKWVDEHVQPGASLMAQRNRPSNGEVRPTTPAAGEEMSRPATPARPPTPAPPAMVEDPDRTQMLDLHNVASPSGNERS
jgi:cell division initiation protein